MQFAEVWQAAFWLRIWMVWQVVPEGEKKDEYQGGVQGHELAVGGGEGDQPLKLSSLGTVKS
jgi:hypothetical protein